MEKKSYSRQELVEIFERLVKMGFGEEREALNDLTLKQLDDLSRGITN